MPLFICDKCHCIENTALGRYWSKDLPSASEKGKALCSECSKGKWHSRFPKEKFDKNKHNTKDFIYIPKELL
jgi:hypothetical protein